ncbi:unnamed protein product [Penicillium salamii]|uniref:Uncharacterized protein n=1 Tax=Penicillium salamii TaxID=1612424 RepID=A0A9W4JG74_9EURO|nr:unnamed protein product [Penicillium salamii]CAG7980901.1 unnamed protein product [Penicillium salamii]CAG8025639.1 unnamed protein product [Penicillium salamii]CAG8073802.1 unnamed protein product [Penicillium salamii]CAG8229378.1 unnamed protein product [Penicillium salamii]
MPNISASDGLWTAGNLGPLTTTFTEPASCSQEPYKVLMAMRSGYPQIEYDSKCNQQFDDSCQPTVATTFPFTTWDGRYYGYASYYSPGLHCPSGWATVGAATRDAHSSISLSGIAKPSLNTGRTDLYFPQTALVSALEPSQTLAMCCPSSMTANYGGGCYSVLSEKPTSGCEAYTWMHYEVGSVQTTYTDATTTETSWEDGSSTSYSSSTSTRDITESEVLATLTGIAEVPMIFLIHHQSDLALDVTGTATSTSTSNAAGRVGSRASWDGLTASLGVSALAMALGAAIVFLA